jgi:hypothetical protein
LIGGEKIIDEAPQMLVDSFKMTVDCKELIDKIQQKF